MSRPACQQWSIAVSSTGKGTKAGLIRQRKIIVMPFKKVISWLSGTILRDFYRQLVSLERIYSSSQQERQVTVIAEGNVTEWWANHDLNMLFESWTPFMFFLVKSVAFMICRFIVLLEYRCSFSVSFSFEDSSLRWIFINSGEVRVSWSLALDDQYCV